MSVTPDKPPPRQTIEQRRAAELDAIANCDTEPIHLVGTVQPFGWLLASEINDEFTIIAVSENVSGMAGLSAPSVLSQSLDSVVDAKMMHSIRNAVGHSTITTQREHLGVTTIAGGKGEFELSAHVVDGRLICELQPVESEAPSVQNALYEAQRILAQAGAAESLDQMFNHAVRELRRFADYDRVKVYRFAPGGAGEIIAEDRSPRVESYLGLRFAAFDIPPAARQMYAATPIRVISDVATDQPAILVRDPGLEIDLSLAVLRGTVGGHTMFLQNMGVGATMSLPLVVNGQMWGLIAFHNGQPKAPPPVVIASCELIGRTLSMLLEAASVRANAAQVDRCADIVAQLFGPNDSPLGYSTHWATAQVELAGLIPCDGVALVSTGEIDVYGDCPRPETIRVVAQRMIDEQSSEPSGDQLRARHTDTLSLLTGDESPGPSAGALLLTNPLPHASALIFFRNEATSGVRWAGDPGAGFTDDGDALRLNPRGSFAAWVDEVAGRCDPWTNDDVAVIDALGTALLRSGAGREAGSKHRERLGLMVRELNHRVRNILALVRSLINQTQDQSSTMEEFVESLERRITALAGAHSLLSDADWGEVRFDELLRQTLAAYLTTDADRCTISGPPTRVSANLASLIALVVHELASNAAKYGSLSTAAGTVSLVWHVEDGRFVFEWTESGGPTVATPEREGFGSSIIRNALHFEFDATSQHTFDPSGVSARFEFDAELFVLDLAELDTVDASQPAAGNPAQPEQTVRVLVLEDDYIIAQETTRTAERLGATSVTTVSRIDDALALIAEERFELALLDANIRGEFSGIVARRLEAEGVPYAFLTGYGSKDRDLGRLESVAIITKPLTVERLSDVFNEIGL